MGYRKRVEAIRYTETIIEKDGVEIARFHNNDDYWLETDSNEEISDEEGEEYE